MPALLDDFVEPDRAGSVTSVSRAGFHRLAYVEWGDPAAERVALCVHGLSRQGRDFDRLAAALAARGWRVVCPDLPGRGRSDWLRNPDDYNLPQYVMDMTALIAHLGVAEVDWIGTSLGGLIGIVMAGLAKAPVRSLVINDIGPFIPWQALHRLATSVRNAPRQFPDLDAAVTFYRRHLAPFGELTDREWRHLARHNLEQLPDGSWEKLSDPEITAAFRPGWFFNLSLWTYWDAITCPTLVLRGELSDLLLRPTALEMSLRGPKAKVIEIPEVGHAPALLSLDQIDIVSDWLDSTPR
ncbi:MAG TPA: alpha/beta hydrolase [Acetobacteraceae bacterium]|nr:alpha/beta hydrolase [Acetobacteraceae bacterium]